MRSGKVETFIPYGKHSVSEEDIFAVDEVLRSDWLTQGPCVERFEKALAAYCSTRYAAALCNATAALHTVCRALGLGAGDVMWTSPNTFVASANCGLYCGADVDFVDIDPQTYNMSVRALRRKLERAADACRVPKVVIPVHFAGHSCEMEEIAALAQQYGFYVVEDASHAVGAHYQGAPVGGCRHSDATVFSFHPVKIITTGEGGAVLTNRPDLHEKIVTLRSHGITRAETEMVGPSHGPWYYQQIDLGYNYRMSDIHAALGISQLGRLDAFVARRRFLADRYSAALADLPLQLPPREDDIASAWHLYVVRLQRGGAESRSRVFADLRERGVGVHVHYIPVHTQPYYQGLGFRKGDFPEAERYYAEALTLPLYPAMTERQQDFVVDALHEVLS